MPLSRPYKTPATPSTAKPMSRAARKAARSRAFSGGELAIGLILTSVVLGACLQAQEPPENLAKLMAHRETETEAERNE